jgi:hypothetical protein
MITPGMKYTNKRRERPTQTDITTLKKTDGSFTADTKETLGLMMETFTPEDNKTDDNEH